MPRAPRRRRRRGGGADGDVRYHPRASSRPNCSSFRLNSRTRARSVGPKASSNELPEQYEVLGTKKYLVTGF